MTTKIDQKAYLQKYLSGPSGDKKKKKKKNFKGKGLQIIDADIDITKLRALDGDEIDFLGEGEDAPQIAGIIDERPEEIKKLEQFKTSSKWRVVNQDDGFTSKLQIQEIKRDVKEVQKDNEIVFGKMYSDSEDEQNNDDSKKEYKNKRKDNSKHNSDSDISPPRKNNESKSKTKIYDSDVSPPRKEHSSKQNETKTRHNYDSYQSPHRKVDHRSKKSNEQKSKRNNDSEASPPRKGDHRINKTDEQRSKRSYDSDHSPPRKSDSRTRKTDQSPPRKSDLRKPNEHKSIRNYDNDQSPPRKKERTKVRKASRWGYFEEERQNEKDRNIDKNANDSDMSPPRKSTRTQSSDSDLSPPRKGQQTNRERKEQSRRNKSDSDESPPRKTKSSDRRKRDMENRTTQRGSDSDLSPPRKNKPNISNHRSNNNYRDANSDHRIGKDDRNDSQPPSNKKMARTLEGKVAGLQDARQLRMENEEFRKKEDEAFKKLADDLSGRNAKAVSRKSKRETSEERQKQKDKAEKQKELDEKYKKWSRGLKQLQDQEARHQDFLHEASKPLARHAGDVDLESRLKQVDRAGDPMLKYIRQKKRERGELGPELPMFKGDFPPNRFNLRPGHRWDGVDRSNGYENKYFQHQSQRKANEEEAYKWSTEDL